MASELPNAISKYCGLIAVVLVSSILNLDIVRTAKADSTLPIPVTIHKRDSYKSLSVEAENISKNFGKNVRAYAKSFMDSVSQDNHDGHISDLVQGNILNTKGLIYGFVKYLTESIKEVHDDYIKRVLKRARNQSQQLLDKVSALQNQLFSLQPSRERKFKDKQVKIIANYMVQLLLQNVSNSHPDLWDRANLMTSQSINTLDNNLKICSEKANNGIISLRTKVDNMVESLQPKIIQLMNQTEESLRNSDTDQQFYICWKRFKNQLFRSQNVHSEILNSDSRYAFVSKSRAEQRLCQRNALNNFKVEIERINNQLFSS